MIDRFHPDVVINIGTAASLNEQLSVDVVIPTSATQWDLDLSIYMPLPITQRQCQSG